MPPTLKTEQSRTVTLRIDDPYEFVRRGTVCDGCHKPIEDELAWVGRTLCTRHRRRNYTSHVNEKCHEDAWVLVSCGKCEMHNYSEARVYEPRKRKETER